MSQRYSIHIDTTNQSVLLDGELTFSTVNAILAESETLFEPIKKLEIDFSDVTRSDSAGVALLVHWIRVSKQKNKTIVFHNLPAQMLAIADSSGFKDILPIQ